MLFSAALAAAGLVAQGVSVVAGTVQGLKNRSKMLEAEAKASQALKEAKNYLQVNVYDKMGIAKEPFKLARDLTLQQGALALQAAREGSARGAAAAAGGIQMAVMNQEQQNRAAMSEEKYALDLKSAAQEQENMQYMASLNLQEAEGAAKAAADAETAMMKSFGGAVESAAGMLGQASKMGPDVIKSVNARRVGNLQESYANALQQGSLRSDLLDAEGKPLGFESAILKNMGISEADAQNLPIYQTTTDPKDGVEKKVLSPLMFQSWLEGMNEADLRDIKKLGFNSFGMQSANKGIDLTPFN